MANSTLKVLHRQAVKTEAQWKSSDPVIPLGVLAISSDKHGIYKCGNGTSKWSALPYAFDAAAYNSPFYGTCGEMDGLPGLVPAPKKNDINKYLKSNGEWGHLKIDDLPRFTYGVSGLCPGVNDVNSCNRFLQDSGIWKGIYQMGTDEIVMKINDYTSEVNGESGWSVKCVKFDKPFYGKIMPTILIQQVGFAVAPIPISIVQSSNSVGRPDITPWTGFFAGVYGKTTSSQFEDSVSFKWVAIGDF